MSNTDRARTSTFTMPLLRDISPQMRTVMPSSPLIRPPVPGSLERYVLRLINFDNLTDEPLRSTCISCLSSRFSICKKDVSVTHVTNPNDPAIC